MRINRRSATQPGRRSRPLVDTGSQYPYPTIAATPDEAQHIAITEDGKHIITVFITRAEIERALELMDHEPSDGG